MIISSKEPILALYDIVKPLYNEIPIYKEVFNEDSDSVPDSYILLRTMDDNGDIYGDGNANVRTASCDILLVTKGIGTDTTDLHIINKSKINTLLQENNIPYIGNNLGYFESEKNTQYSWTVDVKQIIN